MNTATLAKMAWRNIWRNRRRTLITLVGIAFGVLLAVLFTGMADASYSKMIDLAARMGGGHVTLQHDDYLESPSLADSVENAAELAQMAEQDPRVVKAVPRIGGSTMLAAAANSYGAFFVAIDPRLEDDSTLSLLDSVTEGEMFAANDDHGIVLGAGLAKNLKVKLGRKVVYTLTDKSGDIVSGLARVSGIVKTGAPTIDLGLALLPLPAVQKLVGYESNEAVQVAVFLHDHRDTDAAAADLDDRLQGSTVAVPWSKSQPELAGYISVDAGMMVVFEVFIMVLLTAGIFNTLFVSVMERMREFGILMAIGFGSARLFGLVMWESLWIALVGLVVAALVTVGPYAYFNLRGIDFSGVMEEGTEVSGVVVDPIVYVDIFPIHAAIIIGLVVLATLVSGLYPAWRAGTVAPVEAIKVV